MLDEIDPGRAAHYSACGNCHAETVVPFRSTRLERRPWRLVWWCSVCGQQARALVPAELVPTMIGWDRAFGTTLSMREVAEFVSVDLEELARAVEDELE